MESSTWTKSPRVLYTHQSWLDRRYKGGRPSVLCRNVTLRNLLL